MGVTVQNDRHKSAGNRMRKLPDPHICRAAWSGIGGLILCLVPRPGSCPRAGVSKLKGFCFHPDNFEIVIRTQAENGR